MNASAGVHQRLLRRRSAGLPSASPDLTQSAATRTSSRLDPRIGVLKQGLTPHSPSLGIRCIEKAITSTSRCRKCPPNVSAAPPQGGRCAHPDRNRLTPNLRRRGIIVGEWPAIGRTKEWRAARRLPSRSRNSSLGVNWVGCSTRRAMPWSSIDKPAMSRLRKVAIEW